MPFICQIRNPINNIHKCPRDLFIRNFSNKCFVGNKPKGVEGYIRNPYYDHHDKRVHFFEGFMIVDNGSIERTVSEDHPYEAIPDVG